MTLTIHVWHVMALITVIGLIVAGRMKSSSQWDFVTPLFGLAIVLMLVAMWAGWLLAGGWR